MNTILTVLKYKYMFWTVLHLYGGIFNSFYFNDRQYHVSNVD